MRIRFCLLTIILILLPMVSSSSVTIEKRMAGDGVDDFSWEDYFHDVISTEDITEEAAQEMYDHLCMLESAPLNINEATLEDLSSIPGLSLGQASDIIAYRDRYKELRSMEELSMVESIEHSLRVYLSHFLVALPKKEAQWYAAEMRGRIFREPHGDVMVNGSFPFYERQGDNGAYLGDKYKYGVKADLRFSDKVRLGFVANKDGGEPVFAKGNSSGMDYYSFYASVKDLGCFTNITLGRYRVRYGMGLVQNNNFTFGKQSMLGMGLAGNLGSPVITPNSSKSEANYFQGAAATLKLSRDFLLSAFVSYRFLDATLNDNGTVSTIITSGYHRTKTEMDKKYNTAEMTTGGHLSYNHGAWHAGATAVYNWLNRALNPSMASLYRLYYPRGNVFYNASVDYGYMSPRFIFSGETATSSSGGMATLNTVMWKVSRDVTVNAVQRYYSYRYTVLHGNAFSDGGRVQNESGVYLGATWRMSRSLSLSGYSDISYSPWAKYLISSSSVSWDNSLSLNYNRRKWTWLARYRFRARQRDSNTDGTLASVPVLINRNVHRMRISATRTSTSWTVRTQLDGSAFSRPLDNRYGARTDSSLGWMLTQTVGWKPLIGMNRKILKTMEITANAAYFHTDDYDTRLYSYEKGMLYTFSMPAFYGEGMRMALHLKASLTDRIMLLCKVGYTDYFDRSSISSGHRKINASHQTDADIQLRVKF